MTDLKLYESEYRFMDLIWEAEPVRSINAFLTGRRLTAEEARELHRLIEEAVPGDGASEEEHREEKGGSV